MKGKRFNKGGYTAQVIQWDDTDALYICKYFFYLPFCCLVFIDQITIIISNTIYTSLNSQPANYSGNTDIIKYYCICYFFPSLF